MARDEMVNWLRQIGFAKCRKRFVQQEMDCEALLYVERRHLPLLDIAENDADGFLRHIGQLRQQQSVR